MDITINLADGVPIYRQIVNQIKYLVASGLLLPGEELPPIRTLALQLKVTPNTIVKAYVELESSGVIQGRRGAGTFVSEGRQQMARRERQRIIEALERCGGNQSKAAELLGMSRRTFVSRMSEFDLPRPRKSNT